MGIRITSVALATLLLAESSSAFVPHSIRTAAPVSTSKTARSFGVDPSAFHDIPQHIQHLNHLPDAFSSMTLSDAMDAVSDAAQSVVAPAGDVVEEVATKSGGGWFGFLTEPISGLLQLIHSGLMAAGMSENSWGISIVFLTVLIKVLTFPLTKTQLESTNKMQVRMLCLFVRILCLHYLVFLQYCSPILL